MAENFSFEPTYEGWKPSLPLHVYRRRDSFEPTYEGWKPRMGLMWSTRSASSFEPTYEGWKPGNVPTGSA